MNCPKCGDELGDNSATCSKCDPPPLTTGKSPKPLTWIGLVIAFVVVVAGAWLYLGPHFALHKLRLACASGNQEAIAANVDVSAVKSNLRTAFRAAMLSKMKDVNPDGNPFAALGASIG